MSALRRTIAKLDRLAARAATRNPAGDPHVYADGHAVRVGDRVEIARGRRSGDVDFVAELTRTALGWPAVHLRRGGLFGMDEIEFAGFRPTPRSARAKRPGAYRAPLPSRNPTAAVRIEYGIVPNKHAASGGWMPVLWINGRGPLGDTFGRGYGQEEAMARAKAEAEEEAARYVGDWNVSVRHRRP